MSPEDRKALAETAAKRAKKEGGNLQLAVLAVVLLVERALVGMSDSEKEGATRSLALVLSHLPDGERLARRCMEIRGDYATSLQMMKD
ncbi:MAG: hypothetical protein LC136_13600 [Burkholderiales bacterium]|nr:hypothetical protein [Burkholderiales bacterium]